jgi:hypothetical protein
MMISNHAFGEPPHHGHHYTATDAIVGIKVVSYPTGSGFAVLIKLADGSTEFFVDGHEADVDVKESGDAVLMSWKAPEEALAKYDRELADTEKRGRRAARR